MPAYSARVKTTEEVFEDHLRLRLEGKVDEDIRRNYSEEAVIITSQRKFYGHEGVKESANTLTKEAGEAKFEYVKKEVEGEFAYLIWKAKAKDRKVEYGVDSFLIKEGSILVQSVFYIVETPSI